MGVGEAFARLMQRLDSPHSWNVSCLSGHTLYQRNINFESAAPLNAPLTGPTGGNILLQKGFGGQITE